MTAAADKLVQAIANAMAIDGGRATLSDDDVARHAAALTALDAQEREAVAVDLVALAKRLFDSGLDGVDDGVVQLCLLASHALGDVERAQTLIAGGLGADKARAVIGAGASLRPVGAGGRPQGAVSPASAMLENKTKKPGAKR